MHNVHFWNIATLLTTFRERPVCLSLCPSPHSHTTTRTRM